VAKSKIDFLSNLCSYKDMAKAPYTEYINTRYISPKNLDKLINRPYCFFLDSSDQKKGRYSFVGIDPVKIFSSSGGFITIDGHTVIDDPVQALVKFEASIKSLPQDPYLPFHGGLVGFVGHGWPHNPADTNQYSHIPDAWFGLYDTILTIDHLEDSCFVSSLGLDETCKPDLDRAKWKCEHLLNILDLRKISPDNSYIIRTLMPDPATDFSEYEYVKTIDNAKEHLHSKEWLHINVAQRFYSPVATSAWAIHKHLRAKNPTPYASFMRCGSFEISSPSPSCFLKTDSERLLCNVV
jgi:para-aminobenzoate synthetase component 1